MHMRFRRWKKGCQYAVVDEKEYAADGHPRILLVDDCLKALQELANYHRHKMGTRNHRHHGNQWEDYYQGIDSLSAAKKI